MLRILSPVDSVDEVGPLRDAGADELYAGFNPPVFADAFGGDFVVANRRSYPEGSLTTLDAVYDLVFAAAVRDLPVHIALNTAPVPDSLLPAMVETVKKLAGLDTRGVIVADLGLLREIAKSNFRRFEATASVLFSVFNAATVAFLRRAGAGRVVLARELSTADVEGVVNGARGVPLEVLGFRGRCPNIEGFCTHLHDDPGRCWPCEAAYGKEWRGDGPVPDGMFEFLSREEGRDRRFSCGLCAVPILERVGVAVLKIVGRGAEVGSKVEAVRAVSAMREAGREGFCPDAASCARAGKALYREIFGRPCSAADCSFPEFQILPADGEGTR